MVHDACAASADEPDQREKGAKQELREDPWHGQQEQVAQKSENKEGLEHSRTPLQRVAESTAVLVRPGPLPIHSGATRNASAPPEEAAFAVVCGR
jgi:hypothetical protein